MISSFSSLSLFPSSPFPFRYISDPGHVSQRSLPRLAFPLLRVVSPQPGPAIPVPTETRSPSRFSSSYSHSLKLPHLAMESSLRSASVFSPVIPVMLWRLIGEGAPRLRTPPSTKTVSCPPWVRFFLCARAANHVPTVSTSFFFAYLIILCGGSIKAFARGKTGNSWRSALEVVPDSAVAALESASAIPPGYAPLTHVDGAR